MKFLFLELLKARQNKLKKASTFKNSQNFGLCVRGGGKENITPVTTYSGTFEEFSQMVEDEIFQGTVPQNVLEKTAKKITFNDDDTIWFLVDLQLEQFVKVVEFLFIRSNALQASIESKNKDIVELKKTFQDNIEAKNKSIDELKKTAQQFQYSIEAKNKNIDELKSKLVLLESTLISSEDSELKNQEIQKMNTNVLQLCVI